LVRIRHWSSQKEEEKGEDGGLEQPKEKKKGEDGRLEQLKEEEKRKDGVEPWVTWDFVMPNFVFV
jgi:hypothetical protein